MINSILKFGQLLDKEELKAIKGGHRIYLFGQDCYDHFCDNEPLPLPNGFTALCAHPFSCSNNIFEP